MTRKMLAGAITLLLATGVMTASAWGSPGVRGAATQVRPVQAGKVSPGLASRLAGAESTSQLFDVLVSTRVDPDLVRGALGGAAVSRTFRQSLKGFAARLTAGQIRQLGQMPEVERIGADEVVYADIDGANRWGGAAEARQTFGFTGDRDGWVHRYTTQDVVIAVLDTGIDTGHKDLQGKVVGWKDMVSGREEPYDDHGHGTHVAGIAAGAGVANRELKGVAPGAALVGVKVLDQEGSGTLSSVIDGIEWVIAHKDRYHIKVVKTNRVQVSLRGTTINHITIR